jgi:hypothetical protein|tara:strand:- start:742 stop:945 length:204 start_codon:yes stop_codon:yes gene_type:complete
MMGVHVGLTIKDCKNILLWYELYFKKKNKPTQADMNTYTKIKAFAISEKEEDDRFSRLVNRSTREDD